MRTPLRELKLLGTLLYFGIIFGCGGRGIVLTWVSPGPTSVEGGLNNVGFGLGLPQKRTSNERIYFKRVLVDHGIIQSITAISFSSPKSRSNIPFGFSVRLRPDLSVNPIYNFSIPPWVYLSSNEDQGAILMVTTPKTMTSQILAQFPNSISGFSLNRQMNQIAWIDGEGVAYITEISSKLLKQKSKILEIPKNIGQAITLEWDLSGLNLLVQTELGSTLLYSNKFQDFTFSKEFKETEFALFNPDFSQIAYLKKDHSLILANLSPEKEMNTSSRLKLQLPKLPVHDLTWSSQSRISYWVRPLSGPAEVHTLNLLSGQSKIHAELQLPANIGDGVVCPIWMDETLYFGNIINGTYVIERIQYDSGLDGRREIFALPPASDEGFICPNFKRAIT